MQYPREIEELLTEVKQLQNNAVRQLFLIFILLAFTCYYYHNNIYYCCPLINVLHNYKTLKFLAY